ncbi:TnsD family Tn7-like transposition protein [Bacillus sp. FDAARGOS_235]|uniref:TnsD family Tn7-like transposition protein n=1 Tax=Bacillus sp. FDAARGOS_235 TaxID=1839798 RepID=UPI0011A2836C|nr:TnsD family Tn7-like transposition protein [Bacillus sp. FDAARGOS_235]
MNMYFPKPYPDELVFSLMIRYHIHSANKSFAQTSRDLNQSYKNPFMNEFPYSFKNFIDSIPNNFDLNVDKIIWEHSTYPLYMAFLPAEIVPYIRMKILEDTKDMRDVIPNSDFSMLPRYWRYCNHCVRQDSLSYGEPYLKRIHQIAGVPICLIHGSELAISEVRTNYDKKYNVTLKELDFSVNNIYDKLLPISRDIKWIFDHRPQLKEINWSVIYQDYLSENSNFTNCEKELDLTLLSKEIEEFYGETCMDFIFHDISYDIVLHDRELRKNWLSNLIYKRDINSHPILHLLLIHFFNWSYEECVKEKVILNEQEHYITTSIEKRNNLALECILV